MLDPKKMQLPNFQNKNDVSQSWPRTRMIYWILMGLLMIKQFKITDAAKYKGDNCQTKSTPGICKEWRECPILKTLIESGEYTTVEVVNCGFTVRDELICCPLVGIQRNDCEKRPVIPNSVDRPAERACRRIVKGLIPLPTTHITGGTPADLGEFPHMAAIGYSDVGNDGRPPYKIRCGGSLIDKRYVLTAAHCVTDIKSEPSIVRLGVVNLTDVNQMKDAVEIRIKQTFVHVDFKNKFTYNDIAILELEREVETNEFIYPVCLYTDETDPDTQIKLWVSGWGVVNTTSGSFSDVLLKAPLHTSPIDLCNKSFVDYGLHRRVGQGIKRTQICAEDKDKVKDSCKGDSGGPLQMIIDATCNNYRLVGLVTSGFGCANTIPSLYTRVASYLDFIEKIVWPNGGD